MRPEGVLVSMGADIDWRHYLQQSTASNMRSYALTTCGPKRKRELDAGGQLGALTARAQQRDVNANHFRIARSFGVKGKCMGRYRPVSGAHAIDEAVVGVRLFEAVDDQLYQAAIEKASELADRVNLPGRVQLDPMSLLVGRQVVSPGFTEMTMHPGMLFQRVNPDGSMAEELTIERTAVTYRTRSYRRWKDVQGYIADILIPIVSCLSADDSGRLAVIELRCLDKFTASKSDFPVLSELVRAGCDLVPAHLLGKAEYLHIHSGWFDDVSEAGRSLVNLNVDVTDDRISGIQASILQVFSKQSARQGAFFDHEGSLSELVCQVFEDLHAQDKAALARLLTDEVQAEINLAGSSGLGKH